MTDIEWRPSASLANLQVRARLLALIRDFFKQRQVLEVETPILSAYGNPDPQIESFTTTAKQRYLRTSPEYPLKRLLAAGYGDCYEIARVFRQAESGQWHNPEFSLLEWYRNDWHWQQLVDEVIALLQFIGDRCQLIPIHKWPLQSYSYRALFLNFCQLDLQQAQATDFHHLCTRKKLNPPPNMCRDQWLDFIMSFVIQPALPAEGITVIHDFPAGQAALAKLNPDDTTTALRFEIYLGQVELANGYQELTDAKELAQRFNSDIQSRGEKFPHNSEIAVDQNLLAAQQAGLPECAGVALGIDRLLMSLLKTESIDECLAFTYHRA